MLALRSNLARRAATAAVLTGHRSASSVASPHTLPRKPLPDMYQTSSFQKDFLSDPSTYPIIGILGIASCWVLGMSVNGLVTYKDLRITPSTKHQVLRDWGDTEVETITKRLADGPIVMHEKEYRSIRYEGLGVDHEEWKKTKRT